LLSTGSVDIAGCDYSGRTALYWAVEYGHISVVRTLLHRGANPEAADNAGETPLSLARRLGRNDIV
ncbi:ankyrin repeat-containing domain protein, partial [Colletotrichum cereale]